MSDDMDGLDFALLSRFKPRPTATLKGRKKAERKRVLGGEDGRSTRRTGRTAQMNLKVRAEFRERVASAAAARGLLAVELVERAVEAWLQQQGG